MTTRITVIEEISKPPEIVFPWIAEPEKAMRWQKSVKSGEIIHNAPEKIGTTFKEVIEEDGKSLEMYGVITKYEKDNVIAFHLKSKIHEVDVSYTVKDLNTTTQLSVEAIIKWKFPMNVAGLFIGRKIKKNIADQLELEILDLKRICETS